MSNFPHTWAGRPASDIDCADLFSNINPNKQHVGLERTNHIHLAKYQIIINILNITSSVWIGCSSGPHVIYAYSYNNTIQSNLTLFTIIYLLIDVSLVHTFSMLITSSCFLPSFLELSVFKTIMWTLVQYQYVLQHAHLNIIWFQLY